MFDLKLFLNKIDLINWLNKRWSSCEFENYFWTKFSSQVNWTRDDQVVNLKLINWTRDDQVVNLKLINWTRDDQVVN